LDVPCTGMGVLAKRAGLRWRRSPDDLAEMAELQDELLNAAASLVRPGGLLVYSTCTTEPEENEQRVEAFLARHDGFTVESADGHVPDEMVADGGFLATFPHRHRMDGAFAARLRRDDA
ncbi:MAG: 16S rRNA (cytosine(967)-C(5))-methyltransferase RsmB, partial [Salinibacter sp.]